jgi:hypothetical protein
MSIYFPVPWLDVFEAKVMIIPNTFLLNSCRIRKNRYLCEKEKVMIQMGVYLMIGTIIYGSIISLIVAWMLHAKEKDNKSRYTD